LYNKIDKILGGRAMKTQFCEDILKFLKSEYNDSYEFSIEEKLNQFSSTIELRIKSGGYTRIIINNYMDYFHELYRRREYLEDRDQFRWQKELIDLVEGS
jgi:hypothetical protein